MKVFPDTHHLKAVTLHDTYQLKHGPLTRNVKWRVAHAPGMPGTFSPPSTLKETAIQQSRHASRYVRHTRAVIHVGIANPRWREKRSRHSWSMRNPSFYVSVQRPMERKQSKLLSRKKVFPVNLDSCSFLMDFHPSCYVMLQCDVFSHWPVSLSCQLIQ